MSSSKISGSDLQHEEAIASQGRVTGTKEIKPDIQETQEKKLLTPCKEHARTQGILYYSFINYTHITALAVHGLSRSLERELGDGETQIYLIIGEWLAELRNYN